MRGAITPPGPPSEEKQEHDDAKHLILTKLVIAFVLGVGRCSRCSRIFLFSCFQAKEGSWQNFNRDDHKYLFHAVTKNDARAD